jgi:hypothetical protein
VEGRPNLPQLLSGGEVIHPARQNGVTIVNLLPRRGYPVGNIFNAFKAGAKAVSESFGPGHFQAGNAQVACGICRGVEFALRSAPAHEVGSVMPLNGFMLICQQCTHVELFVDAPRRV